MRYLITALALTTCSSAALADAPSGSAVAVDGDTLNVGDVVVRLFGIDAPELDQPCLLEGENWSCGEGSREQLAALLALGTVTCLGDEHDSYGRLLATCHVGGFDINRTMVAEGWAVAYRNYSDAYVAEETRARAARQGIWRSQFDLPQSYRIAREEASATPSRQAAPSPRSNAAVAGGCEIKGNRNRRSEWIYHLPGMPYYNATRPEEIFCSEEAARAAGYRRAIVR